jgi:hypothetical protein
MGHSSVIAVRRRDGVRFAARARPTVADVHLMNDIGALGGHLLVRKELPTGSSLTTLDFALVTYPIHSASFKQQIDQQHRQLN